MIPTTRKNASPKNQKNRFCFFDLDSAPPLPQINLHVFLSPETAYYVFCAHWPLEEALGVVASHFQKGNVVSLYRE